MAVGQMIKDLRDKHRYSQKDVASQAGVSHAWLSKVENGVISDPDPKLLRAIARPLQVDPDELLTAAGYISRPSTIDEMSNDELFAQINRLMFEVKKRTGDTPGSITTQKLSYPKSQSRNYQLVS